MVVQPMFGIMGLDTHKHEEILSVATKVIVLVFYFFFYEVALNPSKAQL